MPDDYDPIDDCYKSVLEAFRILRERMVAGGPGWTPHKIHPLHKECCGGTVIACYDCITKGLKCNRQRDGCPIRT